MNSVIFLLIAITLAACGNKTEVVERIVKELVPVDMKLDNFPEAKKYLVEEVETCGEGVIKQPCVGDVCTPKENNCEYQVEVNQEFLERFKTGLLHKDKNEESYEGVQWMEPTEAEMKAVPEAWDLRDEFPETKNVAVNRQVCGDCWSQSTTKAFELMIAAYDKKIVPLSVQTQINNCRPDYGSCNGGYMTAPDFLIAIGNPLESQDPYKGVTNNCTFSSAELAKGFEYKLKSAPWVGNSLMHSKGKRPTRGNTAAMIKAMMYKYKSPALVTVAAYDISGNAVYSSCSSINSGTNHMVNIVGFEGADTVAHVWNSWGKSHGLNGVSRIKWECGGEGRLNRALGQEARVYVYEPKCANQPEAITGPNQQFLDNGEGAGVIIGKDAKKGQTCEWLPEAGLTYFSSDKCKAFASPEISTEYHLKSTTECGSASALVEVVPIGPKMQKSKKMLTPSGIIELEK